MLIYKGEGVIPSPFFVIKYFNMLTKKQKQFIEYIKAECKPFGVKISLRDTSHVLVSGNIKCAGYFDHENKKIVVAMRHKISFETLLHEYCHFLQWREQCPAWVNGLDSIGEIDSWLSGDDIADIDTHIAAARDLELDNEKRTLNLIYEWGFQNKINTDLYVKRANAYILFYNWVGISRRWSKPGNSPYMNKKILKHMSTKFDMNYSSLSDELREVFMKENI